MFLIRDIVQQSLTTGYLTVKAEERLRELLKAKYSLEDLKAFMSLQEAAMTGNVKQESRELRYSVYPLEGEVNPSLGRQTEMWQFLLITEASLLPLRGQVE
jgi:hypothetical protein